jgi:putative DNA primase/helicase
MTVGFNIAELKAAKKQHPEWVILLADKTKNPQTITGKWKHLTTQTEAELDQLITNTVNRTDIEATTWGIITGLNGICALDFDWEFLGYQWLRKFGERTKTLAIRTANLGFRFLFITEERENNNPYKNNLHVEIENRGFAVIGGSAQNEEGQTATYNIIKSLEIYEKNITFPLTIQTDNTIIADTKKWLSEILTKYDFLQYSCINVHINKKHIRLTHDQRLAIVNFMVSKDFEDSDIHDFFTACYDTKGRDYSKDYTSSQIQSSRSFIKNSSKPENKGLPYACVSKYNEEKQKYNTTLYSIFNFDKEECKKGCLRKKKPTKTAKQEAKEKEIASILEELHGKYQFKTPTDIKEIYVYENGIYKEAECKLEAELEEKLGAKGFTHFITEIIEHLKRSSYTERENFNKFTGGVIPVLNGLLNLTTLERKDYDPQRIFTFKINANYNAEAKCRKFQKFLDETLDAEDQKTLQEYSGYCLMPTLPFHKTMWFFGSGRNGKGTFILTLEEILGIENCAHLNITQLNGERNFSEYQLYGKLINVSSEPTTDTELETPLIKKLTGGDWIDAEVKCKQNRVRFRNGAKFFILGNKYPKVNDNTIAFWERVILLKFTGIFLEGKGQIQNIERTWLDDPEEVSGILNWMIIGLHRLIQNGKFTVSKTQSQTKIEFKRGSDPFSAWLDENCIFGKEYYIPRSKAYDDYKEYCFNNEADPDGDKTFNKQLRGTPRVQDQETSRKEYPKEKRFWIGLCLKTDQETQDKAIIDKQKTKQETLIPEKEVPQKPQKPQVETTENKKNDTPLEKNNNQLSTPEVLGVSGVGGEKKDLHIHRLAPNEPNICQCPDCEGKGARLAVYEGVSSEGKPLFVCQSCLDALKPKLKAANVELIEDYPFREDA